MTSTFKLYKVITEPQVWPCTLVFIFDQRLDILCAAASVRRSKEGPMTHSFLLHQNDHRNPLYLYFQNKLYEMTCLEKEHDPFGPDERTEDGDMTIAYNTPQVRYDPDLKRKAWNIRPDAAQVLHDILCAVPIIKP